MLHIKPIIALLILISQAHASSPLSTNPGPNIAADDNAPLLNASFTPICDSVHYGYNLKEASCEEALARLDHGLLLVDRSLVLVNRDRDRDIKGRRFLLPWRELSSDGSCAIDVTLQPAATQDRSTREPLYEAASQILDTCVTGEGSLGGIVEGLGFNGDLIVTIRQYEGPPVKCSDPAPGGAGGGGPTPISCLVALSFMPVDYKLQIYGPAGDSTVRVVVPKTFVSPPDHSSTCEVTLSTCTPEIPKDQAVNWDIWAAAMKINAMCTRRGLSGMASGIGTRKGLRISLTETTLLDSNATGLGSTRLATDGLLEQ